MRKELVALSVSLFIPTVTFLLFLLFTCGLFLQRGVLTSSPQPAWLHFFVSHLRLLARLNAIGMLCSVLNAGLTVVWLLKGASTEKIGRHLKGMGLLFLLMGGGAGASTLLASAPRLYQALISPHSLSPQMSMSALIQNCLLPAGAVALAFGLIGLVAVTAILSFTELVSRLKRPAPA